MYIFDRFPSRDAADRFAAYIERSTGRASTVYDERRDDVDPFPYELTPPVCYVARPSDLDDLSDQLLRDAADEFGGRYAGT